MQLLGIYPGGVLDRDRQREDANQQQQEDGHRVKREASDRR